MKVNETELKTRCKNVYTIHDKIADVYVGLTYHYTDEDMIRTFLPAVLMDYSLRDIEIICIGIFDENKGVIENTEHRTIDTNCYLFPHSRLSPNGENLKLEDIEKECKEIKAKQAVNAAKQAVNKEENINE